MQRLADLTNFVQKCRSLESDISELVELTSIIDEDDVEVEKQLLEEITYIDVLNKGLKVMDSTAISLCMDNNLPIVVFDLMGDGNVGQILAGKQVGTAVS